MVLVKFLAIVAFAFSGLGLVFVLMELILFGKIHEPSSATPVFYRLVAYGGAAFLGDYLWRLSTSRKE